MAEGHMSAIVGKVLGCTSTACSLVAFMTGTASINKNVTELHGKIDKYSAEAKVDRAEAKVDRAEAKVDRAKAELRDAEAKVDRAETKVDRAEAKVDRARFENGNVDQAELEYDTAKAAHATLSNAFKRAPLDDPENETHDISSKAKLEADIEAAKVALNQCKRGSSYVPPEGPEGELV